MHDEVQTVHELLKSAIITRFRICRVDGEEHPDRSWQRVTCRVHRDDVRGGAVPLLYAVSARSFFARSRGTSDID